MEAYGRTVAQVKNSETMSTIEGCAINAELVTSCPSGARIGGLVSDVQGPLTINDCRSIGDVVAEGNSSIAAGMVCQANAKVSISNSVATDLNIDARERYPFTGNIERTALNNCYNISFENENNQGTTTPIEDLLSGQLIEKLQNGRTDAPHWALLSTSEGSRNLLGAVPYVEAQKEKTENDYDNYLYYDVNRKGLYSKYYNIDVNQYVFLSEFSNIVMLMPAVDFQVGEIKTDRELMSGLNTVCMPYDIDLSQHGFKAYELDKMKENGDTVIFKQVSGKMEAGKPYLIEVSETGENLDATDVRVSVNAPDATKANGVTMTGVYEYLKNDDLAARKAYIMQEDSLWHPVVEGNEAYLHPLRAYLTFDNSSAAKSFAISLAGGDATGISRIATVDNDGTTKYYDLSGRYIGTSLDRAPKGLYINSKGKKVKK